MSEDQEVVTFINKRRYLKGRLTNVENQLKDIQSMSLHELQLLDERAHDLFTRLEDVSMELEALDDTYQDENLLIETKYMAIAGKLKARKALQGSESLSTSKTCTRQVDQLPKIAIPNFCGDYSEWSNFKDLFNTFVHINSDLTDLQKFYYLKCTVKGEAASLIASLDCSSDNYNKAWQMLVDRYDNKVLIANHHIAAILNINKVTRSSGQNLRTLINNFQQHYNSLTSLNLNSLTDVILIHILSQKLDFQSLRDFELQRANKDAPTLTMFIDYLKHRCQALEMVTGDVGGSTPVVYTHSKKISLACSSSEQHKRSVTTVCSICKKSHYTNKCFKFLKMNHSDRLNIVQSLKLCILCLGSNHALTSCPRKDFKCKTCNSDHHTLLHDKSVCISSVSEPQNNKTLINHCANVSTSATSTCLLPSANYCSTEGESVQQIKVSLLPTATVNVIDCKGKVHIARALLDAGSMSNYITSDFANKLNLQPMPVDITVSGIGGQCEKIKLKLNLNYSSRVSNYSRLSEFNIITKITENIPTITFDRNVIKVPAHCCLSDPEFNCSSSVDLILGAEEFRLCLLKQQINLGAGLPGMLNTTLGWVLCGDLHVYGKNYSIKSEYEVSNFCVTSNLCALNDSISKFWRMEEPPHNRVLSPQDKICEKFYSESISRNSEGRYEVDLPVKQELSHKLGTSFNRAFASFLNLERKFKLQPEFYRKFAEFIQEFVDLGHGHWVHDFPRGVDGKQPYYMPTLAVVRPDSSSTSFRVVFHCSSPTTTGVSLNDILHVGPVVQPDLFTVLIRFRCFKYVFISDITKMYRQINIKKKYQHLQRILWRDNPQDEIKCLQLSTVTYGSAPASFLATRTLLQLVDDEGESHPMASEAIKKNTYMDDILSGNDDIGNARKLMTELQYLLSLGHFHLHKWYSNSPELLSSIPEDKRERCKHKFFDTESAIKTLGLKWNPKEDLFQVNCPVDTFSTDNTKRKILASIAKIYDPLGFIGPVSLQAKLIMQRIWKEKLDWDSEVSQEIAGIWDFFCKNLHKLNFLAVPRFMLSTNRIKIELHGFADSSTKGYGCVVYARCYEPNNNFTVHFVCSKSRVAPIKPVTLPRLELCAALLLARVLGAVRRSLTVEVADSFYWTDSMITLSWIRGDPNRWNLFVANRVSEIQELSSVESWNHVKTNENPADIVSRGCDPTFLIESKLWFHGPEWLLKSNSKWHADLSRSMVDDAELPEKRTVSATVKNKTKSDFMTYFERFSSWNKLVNVFSYVIRFTLNLKRKKDSRIFGSIEPQEREKATIAIVSIVQREHFLREFEHLDSSPDLSGFNKYTFKHLKYLKLFSDEGVLRVGGRIHNADLPACRRFPLLLPSRCHVTDLVIRGEHLRLLHAGPQTTLFSVRTRFWPLQARNRTRYIIHKCITCVKLSAKPHSQIMADLPKFRLTPTRPFLVTGLDYAGPIMVKQSRVRQALVTKGWICLFICMSTKCIHLELVSNLTTKEFLNALKRFIARRGKCIEIHSDNASTFKGSNNELHALYKMFKDNSELTSFITCEQIKWKFITPSAPHWGGIWESGIKMVKHHLKRTMGNTALSYEHLNTLLAQIEAILNSRPLCQLSDDTCDPQCLTPSHFLIGEPLISFPEISVADIPDQRLTVYQRICKLRECFWKKWSTEYINTLQMRYKWYKDEPDVKVNSVVLLKEDNVLPLSWPLGRIVEIYKGKDNKVRSVTVKTKTGTYSRPITKVATLPVS